jgi:hypothetical protein
MSVTLTGSTYTATLPNPIQPLEFRQPVKHTVNFMTDGGTRYGYDKGITEYVTRMNFIMTDSQEVSDLVGLFTTDAQGTTNTFTMNDPWGVDHTVRFSHSTLDGRIMELKKDSVWQVSLEFIE